MNEFDFLDRFLDELEEAAARTLQLAALTLQQAATADYRQGKNPPPYLSPAPRGEFPRVRTGFLASSILMVPAGLAAIRKEKRVRVGYAAQAFYGVALGGKGWKWLQDTLDRVRPQLQAAITGAGGIS